MTFHVLQTTFFVVEAAIMLLLIPRVIMQKRESVATLAWVLFLLLVPIGGALLYYFLGTRRLRRRRWRRAQSKAVLAFGAARVGAILEAYRYEAVDLADPSHHDQQTSRRWFALDSSAATVGNHVEVFSTGKAAFESLGHAIEAAEHHIHLLFYIFRPDAIGTHLLELLTAKARAGVEVRLLVDAVGSHELRSSSTEALRQAGGRVAEFLPVSLVAKPFSVNFRNHRKIVVVDGRVAFTGGMNVGDEYHGVSPNVAPLRDTHVRLQGPAALRLQELFADDWHVTTQEDCLKPLYFPPPEPQGDVVVQVVASGPDAAITETIHRSFFSAISRAQKRVWLTTPYFVPDRSILVALYTASLQGVDVRLLLPGRSDHNLVLHASRSYYEELLQAGVRIFEYNKSMLHAKTLVADHAWSTLGSANMDMRSFLLNWEANLLIFDPTVNREIAASFLHDCKGAREIKRPLVRSHWRRWQESGARLLSPIL